MARSIQRVKVADIRPLEDEYGNQFLSRDYDLQVNKDYVQRLAESFGPDGEPDEEVKLIRDGDVYRIKAGNSRVRAMELLGTEECWAVIDDEDTVKSVLETVVRTNVKKKYEPVEESRFVQQLTMFGDDEYVGTVSCMGADKASRFRRARAIVGNKAQQMTLDHLSAVSDFEEYPEWADELSACSEDTWRTVASRLKRKKDELEQTVAYEKAAERLRIKLVDEYPNDLNFISECDDPNELAASYMAASAEYQGIVGRLSTNWSGVSVGFYGEPLNAETEDAAEAERRRLRAECESKAKAVDDAVEQWMLDRFLEVYEGELPGDFRVLGEHCFKTACNQYWVKEVLNEFKAINPEEDCIFLFLAGYKASRQRLKNYCGALVAETPTTHYHADYARKALDFIALHEKDGWEPDEDMAAFIAGAREKLGMDGGGR